MTEEQMDRIIEDKRLIKPKHYKYIVLSVFFIIILLVLLFRDTTSTFRIEKEKVTIEKVFYGSFQDYIRIIGLVEPISIVYLDAVEGGVVEEILIEEGTMVKKGDIILRLSNTNLNLSILNSEAQLAEKANFLRETELNMLQQKLSLERDLLQLDYDLIQKKRIYERNKILYADELISREEYLLSEEDYDLTKKMKDLTLVRHRQDSIYRKNQVAKISRNLENMQKNLELIYLRQENLNIKAPVDGQLGLLDAELGQSINVGQRIGQVNVLTSYKIKAEIDEHYIDRVRRGLLAFFDRQTDTFHLELTKVYPEVRDGRFEVDLLFRGNQPQNIRTGQSYHISLQLGETQEAIQIPRGGFFQSTGGQWIFVVAKDENTALKRTIRIGKQNPQYYEVLEGLEPGEQVLTSGYDLFGDNEKLVFK
ncbi:MAG: efflux RND transporter periplasmic adaptor subunit [Bacteroidales bacterium]